MLLVLVGKSCSGKTSIKNELIQRGWKPIITYTTRPQRDNEVDGVDYYFITEREFERLLDSNFFLEYKYYDTDYGRWYYGSPVGEIEKSKNKDSVIILTPDGYRDFKTLCDFSDYRCVYIYANLETIKLRMVERGDKKDETSRRLDKDIQDFKGIENEVDRIFYNNDGKDVKDLAEEIIAWIRKG